jgi:hypothetical protein
LQPDISFEIKIVINEEEARALDALAGYGADEFISKFYNFLGEYYMKPHEEGLRTFLSSIQNRMPMELRKIDNARKDVS